MDAQQAPVFTEWDRITLPLVGDGFPADCSVVTETYEVPAEFRLTSAELAELLDEGDITSHEAALALGVAGSLARIEAISCAIIARS